MVRKSWFKNLSVGSTMLWITVFVVVPYLFVILFSFAFAFASSMAEYPDSIPMTAAALFASGREKLPMPQ